MLIAEAIVIPIVSSSVGSDVVTKAIVIVHNTTASIACATNIILCITASPYLIFLLNAL